MDENEICKIIDKSLNDVRDFTCTPNWEPLHLSIPEKWRDGFMWMYADLNDRGNVIEHYKHGITRHYLHIDQDQNFYKYVGDKNYRSITKQIAINQVFEGLTSMGWSRNTPYNQEFICARNKGLSDNGYKVIS